MKRKFIILSLIFVVVIFSSAIAFAELQSEEGKIKFVEGENEILIQEGISPFYVSDLVSSYPEILTVTYFYLEEEKGYANIFGGIGEDFIIYPGQKYNFTVQTEMEVHLR